MGGLGPAVALLPLYGCGKRDRAAILRSLGREVIGEMARGLIEETQALHAAIIPWTEDPREDRLQRVQHALQSTLLAWKHAYAFRAGPVATSNAFSHVAFWPAKPASIRCGPCFGFAHRQRLHRAAGGRHARALRARVPVLFGRLEPVMRVDRSGKRAGSLLCARALVSTLGLCCAHRASLRRRRRLRRDFRRGRSRPSTSSSRRASIRSMWCREICPRCTRQR